LVAGGGVCGPASCGAAGAAIENDAKGMANAAAKNATPVLVKLRIRILSCLRCCHDPERWSNGTWETALSGGGWLGRPHVSMSLKL
jgi:carbonic anhydrase